VYTDTAVLEQIETRMPGDTVLGNSDLPQSSNDVPEKTPSESVVRQSTDDIAEQTPGDSDLPCLSDGSPEAADDIMLADGNKVEREQGHSDNEMEIIENGTTDMSIKDEYEITEVVWILEEKTTDGSELKDNGDLYTASLDVDLADQEPSEYETNLLTVTDEEIPVDQQLADTDKTPAQPEDTSTGLVTGTDAKVPLEPEKVDTAIEKTPNEPEKAEIVDEETPAEPEKACIGLMTPAEEMPEKADEKTPVELEKAKANNVNDETPAEAEKADTSDERKSDGGSPVGSVAEQNDTPVAPERNSRLFTDTTRTLVTGNGNRVMISCKHIVVVMFNV
jgi:hypothetical protein